MRIVRVSIEEAEQNRGYFDREKMLSFTDEDIERFIQEDGGDEFDGTGPVRRYTPPGYVRAVRRRTGLTPSAFARRFGLDEAVLEKWENGSVEPDKTATMLLRVVDAEPDAVARVEAERLAPHE